MLDLFICTEDTIYYHLSHIFKVIGDTLLHYLSQNKHTPYRLFEHFLSTHSIDVNIEDKDQLTALHFVVDQQRFDFTRLLITKGADINRKDRCKHTPLQVASCYGDYNMVRILYYAGGCLEEEINIFDNTALHYVKEDNRNLIIFLFKRVNIDYLCSLNFSTIKTQLAYKYRLCYYIYLLHKKTKIKYSYLYDVKLLSLIYSYVA